MNISDEKLYELCREYGERTRMWRQKFAGLLPEVYQRRLYIKKGFSSIFEFAAKLAGMSEEQVRRVLNLEKKFATMPVLRMMLENGAVSVNKLAKVASIATPENQDSLANQVKLLSYSALETLARDGKSVRANTNLLQNFEGASSAYLHLTLEVRQKLLELQQKGIDINQLILKFLEQRDLEIEKEKNNIAEAMKREEELAFGGELRGVPIQKSRHIPVKIKKILREEFGTKCAIPLCTKPSRQIHHTERFALSQSHNPYFLAPLCSEHHAIAHSIDVKVQEKRSGYG